MFLSVDGPALPIIAPPRAHSRGGVRDGDYFRYDIYFDLRGARTDPAASGRKVLYFHRGGNP